jgi:hypothetical protein
MKPKRYFRILFALFMTAGSLLLLQGARRVSAENIAVSGTECATCTSQELGRSNTEFIFFESVTKYLIISLVK